MSHINRRSDGGVWWCGRGETVLDGGKKGFPQSCPGVEDGPMPGNENGLIHEPPCSRRPGNSDATQQRTRPRHTMGSPSCKGSHRRGLKIDSGFPINPGAQSYFPPRLTLSFLLLLPRVCRQHDPLIGLRGYKMTIVFVRTATAIAVSNPS